MAIETKRQQFAPTIQRVGNFAPSGNTVAIDSTSTSASAALPTFLEGQYATDCMIYNSGTVDAFVTFGNTAPTAGAPVNGTPANGIPIGKGGIYVLDKGEATYVAVVSPAGSTTVYFTQGNGS